jgi:pyruvate/2-oxoglutarate dehydrogenase complex dihydrolipoamide acyltransferase (E2) component
VLAEIETDKATMGWKASTRMVPTLYWWKREKIPVNALLCIIGEKEKWM